jgi:hypothetical protein
MFEALAFCKTREGFYKVLVYSGFTDFPNFRCTLSNKILLLYDTVLTALKDYVQRRQDSSHCSLFTVHRPQMQMKTDRNENSN